ncbi:hypothetical protein [Enterococcus sp. DIV0187]|uniref:hypothetical protein n=1 Tax=Enterococcus sp. DIV0187 TaxID=2774644 RepID=UPI003F20C778
MTIMGILFLIGSIGLNFLLVLGAPLGEFAMGGKYKVLPDMMRMICIGNVVFGLFALFIYLHLTEVISIIQSEKLIIVFGRIFSIFFLLNTVMNLFSESNKERLIMAPISLIVAVLFFKFSKDYGL